MEEQKDGEGSGGDLITNDCFPYRPNGTDKSGQTPKRKFRASMEIMIFYGYKYIKRFETLQRKMMYKFFTTIKLWI